MSLCNSFDHPCKINPWCWNTQQNLFFFREPRATLQSCDFFRQPAKISKEKPHILYIKKIYCNLCIKVNGQSLYSKLRPWSLNFENGNSDETKSSGKNDQWEWGVEVTVLWNSWKKLFLSSNDGYPYTSKLEAISTQLILHGRGSRWSQNLYYDIYERPLTKLDNLCMYWPLAICTDYLNLDVFIAERYKVQ